MSGAAAWMATGSVAQQIDRERGHTGETAAPDFDAAVRGLTADEAEQEVPEQEGVAGPGDPTRFAEIRAECRHCGRTLEPEMSR